MIKRITQTKVFVTLLFSISFILLLAIGFASYRVTQLWIANRQQVAVLRNSLFLYERLISLMKDAETAQRGYILTSDSTYLKSYQRAADTIRVFRKSVANVPANHTNTIKITGINKLIDQKLTYLESIILLKKQQGLAAGIAAIQTNTGKALMDKLRWEIRNLQNQVNRQIQEGDKAVALKSQQLTFLQIAGSICSIMLLIWAFWLLRKQIQQRQKALQDLEELNNSLERRVAERTDELHATLEELSASNEELNASNEELSASNEQQTILLDKLNQAQQELKIALSAAQMGTWEWNIQTGEIIWADTMEPIFGLEPGEFHKAYGGNLQGFRKLIHPEDRKLVTEAISAAIESKSQYNIDFRFLHKNGEVGWMNGQGEALYDKTGKPLRMIGIGIQITDRKLTEQLLQQSEERFQVAIKHSPILVFNHDKDLRYTWIYNNPAAGNSDQYVLGKTDAELLAPDEAEPIMALKRQVLQTGIGAQAEIKLSLNGRPGYFSMTVEPLRDDEQTIIGLTCAAFDITGRKEAENQLLASERLKKEIFEGSADALFLVNAQTSTIEDLNQQAIILFGYKDKSDVIGRQGDSLQKYPYTEEQIASILKEIQEKRYWTAELEYVSKTGREFWGNAAVSFISVENQNYFLIRIRDITDRRQADQAIFQSQHEILIQKKRAEQALAIIEKDNERKTKELDEARALQMSMLPQEPPAVDTLDMAMYMKTSVEVGGDYYDYKVDEDGTITVIVGDATGHGLKAGIVVATVKSYFQTLASQCTVSELLHRISEGIQNLQIRGMYMGVTVLKFKGQHVSIASSGMPPLFLYKTETRQVEHIMLKGLFLGSSLEFPYQYTSVEFKAGDTLLVMSDGLPELFNNSRKMLDYTRIEDCYRQVAHLPAKDIIARLVDLGDKWAPQKANEDDITLVTMKAKK